MGKIGAYPWAFPDFTRWQHANCSLVMLQQTMASQFPHKCHLFHPFEEKLLLWVTMLLHS